MSRAGTSDMQNAFGNLAKMLEQFKLPGIDTAAIVASRRKDMDALLAANRSALESMQDLARKQAEVFTQAMQSAQDSFSLMAKNGAAPDPVKQYELARKAYEKAVAQMC